MRYSEEVKKLFGTDGVRGYANHYPMTPEVALALGRAAGIVLRRGPGKHRVVIGKDTRLSCYMFENALVAGLCSMGVDTLMVGPLPTPGVAYITRAYRADAGIVISASHNAYHDNGIKFFSPDGYKLGDDAEKEIERIVAANDFKDVLPPDDSMGKNARVEDAQGRYIEFVKSSLPRHLNFNNLNIVLDCANGAGYRVGPLVFRELGAQVHAMGVEPNGLNINLGCGALHPEEMAAVVRERGAHVGIALDGDGDRLIMADETGTIIDGDTILAICAKSLMEQENLAQMKVVGTVMTNLGIVRSLKKLGIEVVRAPVGDRHVSTVMRHHGARLGGEQSGHLIFPHNTTGDGLVSAVQVLRIMVDQGRSLSELTSFIEPSSQTLISVNVRSKPPIESLPSLRAMIDKVQKQLGDRGRVVVRYSGTESKLRVMVEAEDDHTAESTAQAIAEASRKEIK